MYDVLLPPGMKGLKMIYRFESTSIVFLKAIVAQKVLILALIKYGTKYSGMDQVKFFEDHTPSNFLKAIFHKFYLVHS